MEKKIKSFYEKWKMTKVLSFENSIFIIFFLLFSLCYYDSLLDKGPMGIHLWRQTDCLSLTQNYYEGNSFLEPELHIKLADDYTSGKTAGEFPVIYYLVAQIWKATGMLYLSYRLLYLFILFLGLFSFYKTLRIIFTDFFRPVVLTFLLFTSPVYVIYGISFLTDEVYLNKDFLLPYLIKPLGKYKNISYFSFSK